MGVLARESDGSAPGLRAREAPDCVLPGPAALIAGSRWAAAHEADGPLVVSYSFVQPFAPVTARAPAGAADFTATQAPFSEVDQATVRQVLARIETVCKLRFVEVNEGTGLCGDLRYAYSAEPNQLGHTGYAFYPSSADIGGDIWLGLAQAGAEWAQYRPHLILHETLHALGLQHPDSGPHPLAPADNVMFNTVMSYSALPGDQAGALSHFPAQPMPLDIAALQQLYGAADHASGDTVYDLASPALRDGFQALWDSGGIDLLDASAVGHAVALDLREGTRSDIGVCVHAFGRFGEAGLTLRSVTYTSTLALAPGTQIENARGSAFDDLLTGNALDNQLDGGPGTDTAMLACALADCRITSTGSSVRVVGPEGRDILTGVERLVFTDTRLAFDLDAAAGQAARLVGALHGAAALHHASLVGRALGLLDAGADPLALAQAMLEGLPQGPLAPAALVTELYQHVVGHAPAPQELAVYTSALTSGQYSPASLLVHAAQCEANRVAIDLTGLAQTGLAYLLPG